MIKLQTTRTKHHYLKKYSPLTQAAIVFPHILVSMFCDDITKDSRKMKLVGLFSALTATV